jgi:hypothetical protein
MAKKAEVFQLTLKNKLININQLLKKQNKTNNDNSLMSLDRWKNERRKEEERGGTKTEKMSCDLTLNDS